jgi:hypothetical protein
MHEQAGAIADIEALRRLNESFVRSVEGSDVGYFEAALAEDFVNSNPDGSLLERAGFLAQIARPAGISNLEAHDVRIRLLGEPQSSTRARLTRCLMAGQAPAATPTSGRDGSAAGCA